MFVCASVSTHACVVGIHITSVTMHAHLSVCTHVPLSVNCLCTSMCLCDDASLCPYVLFDTPHTPLFLEEIRTFMNGIVNGLMPRANPTLESLRLLKAAFLD